MATALLTPNYRIPSLPLLTTSIGAGGLGHQLQQRSEKTLGSRIKDAEEEEAEYEQDTCPCFGECVNEFVVLPANAQLIMYDLLGIQVVLLGRRNEQLRLEYLNIAQT